MARSLLTLLVAWSLPLPAAEVSFNREVRPILADKCFECHGPGVQGKEKGGLRLDLRESALAGGDSGLPTLVPGKSGESELVRRLLTEDEDERMPPVDFHARITEGELEVLERWIDLGAEYETHWAFQVPTRRPLPAVGPSGSENAIDRWVEAGLAADGRRLRERAADAVLLRRLHLDLTGLPPTWQEVRSFVENPDRDKVGRLVGRLLDSPHFGERMTLAWMDAARYADTHGYSRDGGRHVWLWRDWCIKAFNDNKGYDQFLREQLAGDLLDDPTPERMIATGFNRLHPITQEGGTIPAENLVNYVADRVRTVGEAMLGLTLECSQCHDHKYDPISQQEYYRFFAFFNTLDDKGIDGLEGRNARPVFRARSPMRDEARLKELLDREKRLLERVEEDWPAERKVWEKEILAADAGRDGGFRAVRLEPLTSTTPNGSSRILLGEDDVIELEPGAPTPLNISFRIPDGLERARGLRLRALPVAGKKTGHGDKDFGIKSFSASFSGAPAETVDLNALAACVRASASSAQDWVLGAPHLALQTTKGWQANEEPGREARFGATLAEEVDVSASRYVTLELLWHGAPPTRFVVELFVGNDPDSPHPDRILTLAGKEEGARSPEEQAVLQDYFNRTSAAKAPLRHELANLRDRIRFHRDEFETMVMDTAAKPRQTRLLERGLYSAPVGEVLKPGVPAVLPELTAPDDREANRLDLADWLLRDDHPLTSRVAVNRIWAMLFGRGLVSSLADFGTRGTYPSHLELLDGLAVEFRESGWDVKGLVRKIVLSRTYQQDSATSGDDLAWDPLNERLARGPRVRLQAELVRDLFLKSSGLLNPQLGGPSVNPYQPGDLWRQVSHFGSVGDSGQTFVQDHGGKLYRRSMYTFWKRTLPPPNMTAFDAPNREVCTAGREVTNTPLQALVLLNDPQFVEASRVLGARLLALESGDDERLRRLFGEVTGRRADDEQLEVLHRQLAAERDYFRSDPARAAALLSVGEYETASEASPVELAAWTNVASLVFNLSQTITKY